MNNYEGTKVDEIMILLAKFILRNGVDTPWADYIDELRSTYDDDDITTAIYAIDDETVWDYYAKKAIDVMK